VQLARNETDQSPQPGNSPAKILVTNLTVRMQEKHRDKVIITRPEVITATGRNMRLIRI